MNTVLCQYLLTKENEMCCESVHTYLLFQIHKILLVAMHAHVSRATANIIEGGGKLWDIFIIYFQTTAFIKTFIAAQ